MTKISVIIPTYNEEKNIVECLTSLQKQNETDFEIIVVDDGSTDKTKEIVAGLGIKIIEQKHQGPAMARNLGAKNAKGKILVFVDADMTFHSKFLRNLVEPIEKNETKGTFSKEEYVSNWDNAWARCWNINQNLLGKRRLPVNYPDHQKVFRAILKSEFDRVGGFSKGGYTDDYTLSEKLKYEATNAPDAVLYHENPDNLKEVYLQAKWLGKREYKLGLVGTIFTLVKSFFPVSVVVGLYKSLLTSNFNFLFFKLVYDFGIFMGILELIIFKKTTK